MPTLNLFDSMKIAKKHGIKFVETIPAKTEKETIDACKKIGFPVAMKLVSSKISHKTDAGGVILNIDSNKEAANAFNKLKKLAGFKAVAVQKMVKGIEIIIGGKTDENFGPTILFGLGGIFVETFKDYSLRVCPISPFDAKEMVHEIKALQILKGVRGKKGANIPLIEKELLKISKMLLKEKKIKELDLNPLIATPTNLIAVDARIVVQ